MGASVDGLPRKEEGHVLSESHRPIVREFEQGERGLFRHWHFAEAGVETGDQP